MNELPFAKVEVDYSLRDRGLGDTEIRVVSEDGTPIARLGGVTRVEFGQSVGELGIVKLHLIGEKAPLETRA